MMSAFQLHIPLVAGIHATTCKTPGTDHNINATCENTMGGFQCGKDESWEQSMVTDSIESVQSTTTTPQTA
jgi:hypothetical protein